MARSAVPGTRIKSQVFECELEAAGFACGIAAQHTLVVFRKASGTSEGFLFTVARSDAPEASIYCGIQHP